VNHLERNNLSRKFRELGRKRKLSRMSSKGGGLLAKGRKKKGGGGGGEKAVTVVRRGRELGREKISSGRGGIPWGNDSTLG